MTLAELEQRHDAISNQITDSKSLLLTRTADVFGEEPSMPEPAIHLKALHAKLSALIRCQHAGCKAKIDPSD